MPDTMTMAAGKGVQEAEFQQGMAAELVRMARGELGVAVMRAKGDPGRRHRRRPIGPAGRAAGIQPIQLLPDGNRLMP